jgi:hypothetical protein
MYYNHWNSFPNSPLTNPYSSPSSSRSRRSRLSVSQQDYAVATLVARREKKSTKIKSRQVVAEAPPQAPDISFADLGPVGRVVAGITQIATTTAMEYCSGFFAGLFLGTAAGVPGFLFRPLTPEAPKMILTELGGRFGRMNARSLKWGRSWGGISAAFGGFKVAVSVIRDGKEDDWNQILSSAAAGAFFARTGKSLVREKALLRTTITNKLE